MDYRGSVILRERLRKNWSQEGLCRGICAVSYLSKIEKGRAEPSEDILRQLLDRLGLHTDRALDRADETDGMLPDDLGRLLCKPVRFRLEQADYLENEEYGRLLQLCFDRCRRELPVSYAAFHLPWMLEWLTATRQYKRAYELTRDFPLKVE